MKINLDYVGNQLQKAYKAKDESRCADETEKADKRIRQWQDVLSGILTGSLKIGSRKPTAYPIWVTPEIARGGFATGKALAATAMISQDEKHVISVLGSEPTRESLFFNLLSDEGLAWIRMLLASRKYKIELPEDSALFVIAWLHGKEREKEAISIIEEIAHYGAEFHFTPKRMMESLIQTENVYRLSANEVREKLLSCKKNLEIERQREAHQIWIPYLDKLVFHWLALLDNDFDESKTELAPDQDWKESAAMLVKEYEKLKKQHQLCRKYHNKEKSLQIILSATREFLADHANLSALSRAKYVVSCYINAHGKPGETRFEETRQMQRWTASLPSYQSIAKVLLKRIPISDGGLSDVEDLLAPVDVGEHTGVLIPKKLSQIVNRGLAAPIPELLEKRIIPSSEVLAELTPQLTALEIGKACNDADLQVLMAESYKAFCRRRSVLLMDLSAQVRFDELPWIKPILNKQSSSESHRKTALSLASYAIDAFPGVILPNPLIEQLNALYYFSSEKRPFLAELAADIFTGHFVQKFDDATLIARDLLRDSLYERYYGLKYDRFFKAYLKKSPLQSVRSSQTILELMIEEEIRPKNNMTGNFVVKNGIMIERAQIYTAHNLATLISEGIQFEQSYEVLASSAFKHALRLMRQSKEIQKAGNRYLAAVKNAAYAWRQALFFLSLSPAEVRNNIVNEFEKLFLQSLNQEVVHELFKRLKICLHDEYPMEKARPFTGWTFNEHWIMGK